jgi:hypothetical protein
MKNIITATFLLLFACSSCKKVIDQYPQSNLYGENYYTNEAEVRAALTGCYNGLQEPMKYEWQMSELRSDNTKMGSPGSTSSVNRDFSDLDMFMPAPTHQAVYLYWLASYNNVRNANIVLQRLGVTYDPASGTNTFNPITIPISDSVRRQLAGEAMVIRAHHYFNLVRLFGKVFLVHTPVSAAETKTINRAPVAEVYKLIEADLRDAAANTSNTRFNQIAVVNVGRVSSWTAKALLAKVLLNLNRKTEAATLLTDVKDNSGFGLQPTYSGVFSISNEMNSEILFTVRYKAGGFGLGSSFGNEFAAELSGSAIINGSGKGYNFPTNDFDTLSNGDPLRKSTSMDRFINGNSIRLYVKKFLSQVVLTNDGESDWPIMRYSDVLLMLAEAQGYSPSSIALINQVRSRAGLGPLSSAVNSVAAFERALSDERRLEFAFENQRFFDLLRFNATLTTITAESEMKAHFTREFPRHYAQYPTPALTLQQLLNNVTPERMLLPIPQHEIDTNTQLVIEQNPGY